MAADDAAQFSRGLFFPQSDLEVSAGEPAVLGEEQPGAQPHDFSQAKQETHRKSARDCRPRAIQKVDAEIEHAGAATQVRPSRAEA